MTTHKELLDLRTANTPRGVGTQTNIFADRARNAEIWDVEGNHYIDLAAGIAWHSARDFGQYNSKTEWKCRPQSGVTVGGPLGPNRAGPLP